MPRQPIIAVIGHDKFAREEHKAAAEKVGREIARRGAILICGGMGGVPIAAACGASEEGGTVLGILPNDSKDEVPLDITIPVMTGMGFARNQIIALTADAVIAIGGGVGTFTEAAYSYLHGKPIIVLETLDGILQKYAGKYLDEKKITKILGAKTPEEAVDMAFRGIRAHLSRRRSRRIFIAQGESLPNEMGS